MRGEGRGWLLWASRRGRRPRRPLRPHRCGGAKALALRGARVWRRGPGPDLPLHEERWIFCLLAGVELLRGRRGGLGRRLQSQEGARGLELPGSGGGALGRRSSPLETRTASPPRRWTECSEFRKISPSTPLASAFGSSTSVGTGAGATAAWPSPTPSSRARASTT